MACHRSTDGHVLWALVPNVGNFFLAGRFRLTAFRDTSWPQLLQWHDELCAARSQILLDFPAPECEGLAAVHTSKLNPKPYKP